MMMKIGGCNMYDYKQKNRNLIYANNYVLAKTLSMFNYKGLPDTIPERELERLLQETGAAFIYQWGDDLIAFKCSYGGVVDEYNQPTKVTITNHRTKKVKTVDIDDGVLIMNDDYQLGLLPMIEKYNTFIQENEISMIMNNYLKRMQMVFVASDDRTKESAKQYFNKLINGELSVIGQSKLLEDLEITGSSDGNAHSLKDLMELNQYLKASLNNEIGIIANETVKKERLITAEIDENKHKAYPFITNMFVNRKKAIETINNKFNLNASVEFGSIWSEGGVVNDSHNHETVEAEPNSTDKQDNE